MKRGVNYNITTENYLEIDALSASLAIDIILHGPARAWVNMQSRRVTAAMEFGSAAHIVLLEPQRVDDAIVVIDAHDRKKQATRQAEEDARDAGKIPLLEHQMALLMEMQRALRNELGTPFRTAPDISKWVGKGDAEVTVISGGAVPLKCRPDLLVVGNERDTIVDYKSTALQGDEIRRETGRRGYAMRAAFYLDCYRRATNRDAMYIYLIQEKIWPFFAYTYIVDEMDMTPAVGDVVRARQIYEECRHRSGKWPSDVEGLKILPINNAIWK